MLWLTSANPITVAASDARANADITAILGTVQSFTELPTIAPIGYQVEIEGDPGNNFDGYYVHFQPRGADVTTAPRLSLARFCAAGNSVAWWFG